MAVQNVDSLPSQDVASLEENSLLKFNVKEICGIQFLVHKVLMNDTLSMLSLKYNVS